MVDEGPIDFVARRNKWLEENGQAPPVVPTPPNTPPAQQWDPSLQLPDLDSRERSDEDKELDGILERIDIATAYNKWIGKMHATITKHDGNMVSCPMPDHADPPKGGGANGYNAWLKQDGTWYCGKCDVGGDKFDLAAIHFGYPMPGYKDGQLFHKLRQQMAESFGWTFKKVAGGTLLYKPEEPSAPESVPATVETSPLPPPPPSGDPGLKVAPAAGPDNNASDTSGDATPSQSAGEDEAGAVSQMWADDGAEDLLVVYPTINWRRLVPEDTFLYEYLDATSGDDSPEEYHFWHGLLALGSVCGRKVTLDDHRPVYSNLMVCLLGATGVGKSRSRGWLDLVLKAASPYSEDGTTTTGTKLVPVPSSGEYLVSAFSYEGKDPGNGKSSVGFQPVNGIVDFDEMSALLARANREGSSLKPTIMAFADARDEVKIGSLTRGEFIAQGSFCSITASTQPKAVRTLLKKTDSGSGFLNRWIFAGGKEKEIEALGGSHSDTVINLETAIERLKNVRGWGSMERSITLQPSAYEEYVRYFRTTLDPMKKNDDTDLLKRIDLISKKLMLLLTINKRQDTVDLQTVKAMELIIDYIVDCFGIVNENIGVSVMQEVMTEIQRHIRRHIEKTGRGASVRDIMRYTQRKAYTMEQIKKSLDVMSALDLIELAPKNTGAGRPTVRYLVVGE